MKAVSEQTLQKLQRLGGQSFWNRVFGDTEQQVALLREIGGSDEVAAIPEIAWLVVEASGPIWRAAIEAVHRLVGTLSPLDLAALDHQIREVGSYDREVGRRWRNLRPSGLSRFASSEFAVSLLGLASFHNNGHVREGAVEKLSLEDSGQELPFLIIRLNDWVVQVREIAANAVNARLRPRYAGHFLRNLRLILRLQGGGRTNRALLDSVCALLRRAECKDVLEAGMKSSDRALRRASFQLAAESEQSTRTAIIRAALSDPDPVARAWAVRRFLPEVPSEELASLTTSLLADRFMPVRRDALWELSTHCPDSAMEHLKRALLDSHVGMREIAGHFLAKHADFDIRRFYVGALERGETRTMAAAIRGLGETGRPEDATLVSSFLDAPTPRFRRAATYAVGKLDAERFLSRLTEMLADETPGVSREALRALLPKARQQSLEQYRKLFANDKRVFVRRNVMALMLRFGKWEKLPPLLFACVDEDHGLVAFAQNALRAWFRNYNSSFAEPTRADLETIQDALARTQNNLPKGAAAEIRACLKIYSK